MNLTPIFYLALQIALLTSLSACTDDGDGTDTTNPDHVESAAGTWALNVTYLSGSCDQSGTHALTLDVTKGPNGYLIAGDAPLTVTGTSSCNAFGCTLKLTASDPNAAGDPTWAFSVTSSAALEVTGSGTLTIGGTTACSDTFSVDGTVTP